ncbi:hypothetical protein AVDCRST_MAG81-1863 [uncultured Synechococcales cyanobacterium]|uniref:Uncharacterized protein n=1 Tax=uncultured Synechococcales cyanobacterium TaxID=1936017 RepID=A0A6J4UJN3_9CYAN|nr:hypothetical protein AVDCRST_MAG81-1863 [uncultured Synechococcales cyanobacterium]
MKLLQVNPVTAMPNLGCFPCLTVVRLPTPNSQAQRLRVLILVTPVAETTPTLYY